MAPAAGQRRRLDRHERPVQGRGVEHPHVVVHVGVVAAADDVQQGSDLIERFGVNKRLKKKNVSP